MNIDKIIAKHLEADFATAFRGIDGKDVIVFKNPSRKEVAEVRPNKSIPAIATDNDLYLWSGRAFHGDIMRNIPSLNLSNSFPISLELDQGVASLAGSFYMDQYNYNNIEDFMFSFNNKVVNNEVLKRLFGNFELNPVDYEEKVVPFFAMINPEKG